MRPDSLDRRVSILRHEDSRKRVISFGSSTKKTVGLFGMRMLSSYGPIENLWDSEEPKKPVALGLTDKTLTTVDDLLATVLQKADSEQPHDRDFITFFFLGYVRVLSSEKLLDFIVTNFLGSNTEKSLILLDNWVNNHWNSFSVDYHNLTRKLRQVRNLITDKEKSIQLQDLIRIIHKKDKMMNNKPIDIEDATLPINMHEINPLTFARQLTLFYEDYWDKVAPVDLMDTKRHSDTATPIGTLYDNFNRLTEWVKSVILTEVDPGRRKSLVKTFLHLKDLRNFAGLFSVMLGLSAAQVLKVNNHKDRPKYKNLFQVLSPAENYRTYRHEVVKEKQFSIPAYVVHSRDLIHTEELSPLTQEGKVNVFGLLSIGRALYDVFQLKKTPYNIGMRFLQYRNHFQNLITLSEDAQWDCARHITTLMADPSATVPTPKIITEFLEQCMAVKSVVIDSNELTQDRTNEQRATNEDEQATANQENQFSQGGRDFLVGGGRRNPVINPLQQKDGASGTTATSMTVSNPSTLDSDMSPRQQQLRNARTGGKRATSPDFSVKTVEPMTPEKSKLPLSSPRLAAKQAYPEGSPMAAIDAMMKEHTKAMVKSMDHVIASFTEMKWNVSRDSDKLRNSVVASIGEVVEQNNSLKSDVEDLRAQLSQIQKQLASLRKGDKPDISSSKAKDQHQSVSLQDSSETKESEEKPFETGRRSPTGFPVLPKPPVSEPSTPTQEESRPLREARRRITPPSPSQHQRRVISIFDANQIPPNSRPSMNPIPISSIKPSNDSDFAPSQTPQTPQSQHQDQPQPQAESMSSFSSPRPTSASLFSPRGDTGSRAAGLVAGLMQLFRDKDFKGTVKVIGSHGNVPTFPDFSNEKEIKDIIDTWREESESKSDESSDSSSGSSSEANEETEIAKKNSESLATDEDSEAPAEIRGSGMTPMIFFSSNPRASYRLTPLAEPDMIDGLYGHLSAAEISDGEDWKGKGREGNGIAGNRIRTRTRTGTIGTGDGASSGSDGDDMLEAGEGDMSFRSGRKTSNTLHVPNRGNEGNGEGGEGRGRKTRERKNSVMMIDLRAGSFVPLVLKVEDRSSAGGERRVERRKRRATKVSKRRTKKTKRSEPKKEGEETKESEQQTTNETQTKQNNDKKKSDDYAVSRNRSKSLPSRSKQPKPKPSLIRSVQPDDPKTTQPQQTTEDDEEKIALKVTAQELEELKNKLAMFDSDKDPETPRTRAKQLKSSTRKHMKKSTSNSQISSPRGTKVKRKTLEENLTDSGTITGSEAKDSKTIPRQSSKPRLNKEIANSGKSSSEATKVNPTTAAIVKGSGHANRTRTRSRSLPSIPREDLFPLKPSAPKLATKPPQPITQTTGWSARPAAKSRNFSPLTNTDGSTPRKASFLTATSRSNRITGSDQTTVKQ